MFNAQFEKVFVDFLNRNRDFSLLFKDHASGNQSEMSLTMQMVAPQCSVSLFEFDAFNKNITAATIIDHLVKRVKTVVGSSRLESEIEYSEIEQAYIASKILGDSMIVIHNAEKLPKKVLSDLQRLSDIIRSKNSSVRLRVLAIGDIGLMHLALAEHLKFINLKFYNLMANKASMDAVLMKVTDMTVGSRLSNSFEKLNVINKH